MDSGNKVMTVAFWERGQSQCIFRMRLSLEHPELRSTPVHFGNNAMTDAFWEWSIPVHPGNKVKPSLSWVQGCVSCILGMRSSLVNAANEVIPSAFWE
jgi:hypothetical protein